MKLIATATAWFLAFAVMIHVLIPSSTAALEHASNLASDAFGASDQAHLVALADSSNTSQ